MTNAGGARIARAFVPSGIVDLAISSIVLAVAFGVVVLFSVNTTNANLAIWLGHRIVTTHALPTTLGSETFTAAGTPLYQGWLGAVFTYLASFTPGSGAVLGVALFFLALLVALVRANDRGAGATALVAIAALFTFAGLGALSSPSTTLNWLLLSLTLLLVERGDPRAVYACAALSAIWCNLDAQGVLVPGVLLLAAVSARISDGNYSARTSLYLRAGALALVATLLTPAFLELPLRAATYLQIDPALGHLREWQPSIARAQSRAGVIVALVLAAALAGTWRRERAFDALLVIAATLFALMNATYAPEFVLAAAPVIVPGALGAWSGEPRRGATTLAVLLAFVSVTDVTLWGNAMARRSTDNMTPTAARLVPALAADGKDHRVYCSAIEACDALVASDNPHLRVFMDDRLGAYAKPVVEDQVLIASVRPKWQSRLRAWNVDAIVVRRGQQLGEVLALLPHDWHEASNAGSTILFLRGEGP